MIQLLRRIREAWQLREDGIVARMIPMWRSARALPHPHDVAKFADEGYRKNAVIHACIKELARSTAEPKITVGRLQPDLTVKPLTTHPLIDLMRRPNRTSTMFQFLEKLVTHLHVSGNAYVHKLRSEARRPAELWLLRPDRVKIKPGATGLVETYFYSIAGEGGEGVPIPAEDVIQFSFVDPLDDYYGLSPVAVLARWGDIDNQSAEYLRAFFFNQGQPAGYLKYKSRVNREEREKIKAMWMEEYAGTEGWHRLAVLDADVEYQEVGKAPDRLRLGAIWDETESRICSVFGVPPIIVGTHIGLTRSTYSNYRQAVRSFWLETLNPMYRRIGEQFTHFLAREFDENLIVGFDTSTVGGLQESQESLRVFALNGWDKGILTRNEARQKVGLATVDGGDVFKEAMQDVFTPTQVEVQGKTIVIDPDHRRRVHDHSERRRSE